MTIRRFARPDATVRIHLRDYDGSDDWVDVRESLTFVDSVELRDIAIGGATQSQDGVRIEVAAARLKLELLKRSIVAWSFRVDPADPAPVPVSPGAIERLDANLGDWLAERIDGLYSKNSETSRPSLAPV